ncbi:kinase/pyrophosphorylase [Marivibrio halodurans]|uniref:Putative pyruvate, phosphate dikinase regulatory protein n=1 Tax=Marivibrio halodurans TaxID=2039722 RepID=A0A8J7V3N7_9PROT|nr:kinase/pyrophosphorylase [Marivibrio halodurans]
MTGGPARSCPASGAIKDGGTVSVEFGDGSEDNKPERKGEVVHLHLVSDSTGETVHGLARACIVQFEDVAGEEHLWTLIRTPSQLDKVLEGIRKAPGIVMFTLVNDEMREKLALACRELRIPCLSVLDPFITSFETYLGRPSRDQPGRQHEMDTEYFARIEAMQYALAHDDGQGLWNLPNADVVVIGVSRTSKTPTCIYLANRGVRAANVPFVPGMGLPREVLALGDRPHEPLVVGLTKDPAQLVQIRKNRMRMLAETEETDYVDLETVRQEVTACRRICSERRWPVIDVSRRSIEETAATIMKHYERHIGRAAGRK